jgi:rhodanese-related sulfurtransferase/CBS domain-containing protein
MGERPAGFTAITYPRVRELLDAGGQLVEVLPHDDWEELHLPGAISLPLKQLSAESSSVLDRSRPVITYCWDGICDLSARAARQLAILGFEDVYDYAASKVDWMARGLPLQGRRAAEKRALDFAGPPVVTCGPDDSVGPVRDRVEASAYGFALVVSGDGVVLGRLRRSALQDYPQAPAGEVMEPGPSTKRPNLDPGKLLELLERADLKTAVLSDPEGRLLGIVRRADLHAAEGV